MGKRAPGKAGDFCAALCLIPKPSLVGNLPEKEKMQMEHEQFLWILEDQKPGGGKRRVKYPRKRKILIENPD